MGPTDDYFSPDILSPILSVSILLGLILSEDILSGAILSSPIFPLPILSASIFPESILSLAILPVLIFSVPVFSLRPPVSEEEQPEIASPAAAITTALTEPKTIRRMIFSSFEVESIEITTRKAMLESRWRHASKHLLRPRHSFDDWTREELQKLRATA